MSGLSDIHFLRDPADEPGPIGYVNDVACYDMAEFNRLSGIRYNCLICRQPITEGRSCQFHSACLACHVCGSERPIKYGVDGPATVLSCNECAMREQHAADERARIAQEAKVGEATELLLSGGGSREEREAALQIIREDCWESC